MSRTDDSAKVNEGHRCELASSVSGGSVGLHGREGTDRRIPALLLVAFHVGMSGPGRRVCVLGVEGDTLRNSARPPWDNTECPSTVPGPVLCHPSEPVSATTPFGFPHPLLPARLRFVEWNEGCASLGRSQRTGFWGTWGWGEGCLWDGLMLG